MFLKSSIKVLVVITSDWNSSHIIAVEFLCIPRTVLSMLFTQVASICILIQWLPVLNETTRIKESFEGKNALQMRITI